MPCATLGLRRTVWNAANSSTVANLTFHGRTAFTRAPTAKAAIWWNKERASNFSTAIVWRLKEALGKLVNRTRNEDAWEQRTSLDAPITDSEDTIAKLVADDRLPPLPYDSLDAVRNMMRTLPRTHRIVIQLRYLGHEQRTLEQIAAYFGFSKERARQYEDAALEMLRRRMAEGEKEC